MSDNSNRTESRPSLGRYKFVWLLLFPLVVLLAVAAYLIISEWSAAKTNRTQFEQWAATGIPYDSATLQKSYDERTHPEGTPDWIEITRLVYWGAEVEAFKQLPYLGNEGQEPANLVPGGKPIDWPGEPLVASYLEEMQPVIDLIEQASEHPTPARFPVNFHGIDTLLPHVQNSRKILWLLSLDCDFAYFNQDNKRALRDLSLMKATAEAYDGRECLVSGLVNVALRSMRMGAMRRTLSYCEWTEAELQILRDSLTSPEEVSDRWQDLMLHERAFGLSFVGESPEKLAQSIGLKKPFKLFTRHSEVKNTIEGYQRMVDLPIGADVKQWRKQAAALEDWATRTLSSNSLAGMLLPAVGSCFEAEIRNEEERRWTLTAVAIQQFKQQNEKWPTRLAELESVGLKFDDYSDTEQNVFGYEIEGDKVFLWKQDGYDSAQISKTRPLPSEKHIDVSYFIVELN